MEKIKLDILQFIDAQTIYSTLAEVNREYFSTIEQNSHLLPIHRINGTTIIAPHIFDGFQINSTYRMGQKSALLK